MMKKIMITLIITLSIISISFASLSNNWEKRAKKSVINQMLIRAEFMAKDNYDENKLIFEIDKPLTYLFILETAYSDHLNKDLKDILFQKENGREFYSIILNLGTGEAVKQCILRFVYESKSEELVGYQIGALPEGWKISTAISPPPRLMAILDNDEDGFFFNLDNPLVSWVWVDGKVYKIKEEY